MPYDVITIGSATYDFFLQPPLTKINWPKTPAGSALVLPLGEKISVEEIYSATGGNALNAAATFSYQGYKTAAVAKIGQDIFGKEIVEFLKKTKVGISFIKKDKELKTAYSIIFRREGERLIISYPGASHNLNKKDLRLPELKSQWWYVSLSGKSYKLLPDLLKFAVKNKILVALNPTGYHIQKGLKELKSAIKQVAVLVVNETEAEMITGVSFKKEKEMFKKIDMMVPGIVVVTAGQKGAMASDGRFVYRVGVFPSKVIDRTGAGDAFGSGFVAGLLRKNEKCDKSGRNPENIKYALRLSSANASSVITKLGAGNGLLSRKEFESKRFANLEISSYRL